MKSTWSTERSKVPAMYARHHQQRTHTLEPYHHSCLAWRFQRYQNAARDLINCGFLHAYARQRTQQSKEGKNIRCNELPSFTAPPIRPLIRMEVRGFLRASIPQTFRVATAVDLV